MTTPERSGPDGILLVDKPAAWTSHDVVARLRRLARQRRIGHTGTLDPMATGLLVLCLGTATRLVEYMTVHDKRYTAEITLGARTDTDDAEGEVIARSDVPEVTPAMLRALEARFTGEIRQRPPAYSAIKIAGQRAYALARKGEAVELPDRPVVVHELALRQSARTAGGAAVLGAAIRCGSGTYIRALARDIGEVLGCGGHLSALRRLTVGEFHVRDGWTLTELEVLAGAGLLDEALLPPDEGLLGWHSAVVDGASEGRFGHGIVLALGLTPEPPRPLLRVYGPDGAFLGTAAGTADGGLKPLKVFPPVDYVGG